MTDMNHLVLTLSEECDSTSYLASNFQIIDSTSNQIYPILIIPIVANQKKKNLCLLTKIN